MDESTGFDYRISVVDAEPGAEAIEYVKRNDKQNLNVELKNNARKLGKDVTTDYEERLNKIVDLQKRRLISEEDARNMIRKIQVMVENSDKLIGEMQGGTIDTDVLNDDVLSELYQEN